MRYIANRYGYFFENISYELTRAGVSYMHTNETLFDISPAAYVARCFAYIRSFIAANDRLFLHFTKLGVVSLLNTKL